jgi:hypothetical protein
VCACAECQEWLPIGSHGCSRQLLLLEGLPVTLCGCCMSNRAQHGLSFLGLVWG